MTAVEVAPLARPADTPYAEFLAEVALFAGLGPAALEDLCRRLTPRHVAQGEPLCREGDAAASLFVVQRGVAEVVLGASGAGERPPPVARLRRGDVVGELALLTSEPRSATVVARVPSTVLELARTDFLALLERHPAILRNLVDLIGHRLTRRNAFERQGRRGEAVAVIVGPGAAGVAEQVVSSSQAAAPSGQPVCAVSLSTGPDPAARTMAELCDRIDALRTAHRAVLVSIALEHVGLPTLLGEMDRALLLGDVADAARLGARLGAHDPRVEVALVGVGSASVSVAGFRVVRVVQPECRADVAWLGRHLSRTKLGIALGAGGAKGYAHIGVLEVLHGAGYTIDYVAGSSIGAWIGCWVAQGFSPAQLDDTLRSRFTPEVVEAMFRKGVSGNPSGIEVMSRLGQETTGGRSFADLALPLTVMTADLCTRRPAPLNTGALWPALVAAMTVPGLYPPYTCGDRQLMDAVSLEPVPTRAVAEAGADVTVAVNLISRETLAAWPDASPTEPLQRRGHDPVRDALLDAVELGQLDASVRQARLADVPVTPRFGPGTWRHFHLADRFLTAGRAAAEEQLPALRALARPVAP